MEPRHRILGIVVLLVVTGGFCVQFAATDVWTPSQSDLAADPVAHDGDQVLVFGTVQSVEPDRDAVVVSDGTLEARVTDVDPKTVSGLEAGGEIQVAGTFHAEPSTIAADEVVVDIEGESDRRYVYGTSILGGLLAVVAFLRTWRIDVRGFRFVPRGER
ncbi:hypothetical protein FYC77_17510 [Natrialba swarupiae]|uniref:Uncharacterized protein n=2 Tax=Natrialba swarupiae TaxID=2448032 RepID=A0A5D5AIR6_9EURY|nr:hypothetical protein FYC77_17510 [Natrialba swarupiae]